MGALRRWLVRLTETDEARLDAGIRDWAESVPGSVRIGQAPTSPAREDRRRDPAA